MIHYANEFGKGEAQIKLESLKTKFKYNAGDTAETVSANVDALIAEFYKTGFVPYPKMVVTPTYYAAEGRVLESASFTVRPSTTVQYYHPSMKTQFTIFAGENFYSRLVANFAEWFDFCIDTTYEYENLEVLKQEWDAVIAENNIPFSVNFDIGEGIMDVSDDSITLGIKSSVIRTISKIALFDTIIPSAPASYKETLAEALKNCTRPTDIVKQNIAIFGAKSLGIFSRKSIVKLIRQHVTRKLAYTRVGVGYAETPEWFAVIEKVLATPEEAAAVTVGDSCMVIDNANPAQDEVKKGQTKIIVRYKVSPFNANNEAVAIAIKDIVDITRANGAK